MYTTRKRSHTWARSNSTGFVIASRSPRAPAEPSFTQYLLIGSGASRCSGLRSAIVGKFHGQHPVNRASIHACAALAGGPVNWTRRGRTCSEDSARHCSARYSRGICPIRGAAIGRSNQNSCCVLTRSLAASFLREFLVCADHWTTRANSRKVGAWFWAFPGGGLLAQLLTEIQPL